MCERERERVSERAASHNRETDHSQLDSGNVVKRSSPNLRKITNTLKYSDTVQCISWTEERRERERERQLGTSGAE